MKAKSRLILAALAAAASLALAAPSSAMPTLSTDTAISGPHIEQAGWRCGPGAHVNRFGRCVSNFRPMFRPHRHPHWHPRHRLVFHHNY